MMLVFMILISAAEVFFILANFEYTNYATVTRRDS